MSNGKDRGRDPNQAPWNQGPPDEPVFEMKLGSRQPTTARRVPSRMSPGGTRIGPFDQGPPVLLVTPKISPDDPGFFRDLEIGGRYTIREHISSGGFGHVYRGEQDSRRGGGMRAIKVVPFFGRDPKILHDLAQRFQTRESLLGADVVHPNLLPLDDAGFVTTFEVSGRVCPFGYLVTPLIPKCETLEDHIGRTGALPWPAIRALFTQICGALGTLHLRGVMHRDIKPANILYVGEVEGYPAGFIYLIDLGSALVQSRIIDEHGEMVATTHPGASPVTNIEEVGAPFTPGYAPPEVYEREKHDVTFDVFSLGCVLYFMVTGERIDESENHHKFMDRLVRQKIPHMRSLRSDCPAILDKLLWEKLLAVDPITRPSDANVAFREVDAILAYIIAPRPTPRPRAVTPIMRATITNATQPDSQQIRRQRKDTTWLIVSVAVTVGLITSVGCLLALHWIFS